MRQPNMADICCKPWLVARNHSSVPSRKLSYAPRLYVILDPPVFKPSRHKADQVSTDINSPSEFCLVRTSRRDVRLHYFVGTYQIFWLIADGATDCYQNLTDSALGKSGVNS
jgi:hypothetical protein